ncbi:cytochrome P450 [Streptomyces sp. NPDC012510]|uniref:cytochrome P450 n=1 Tax=Streptomyces sp. NPDC012510 TaxID=3364838 RepID=UPI0036E88B9F
MTEAPAPEDVDLPLARQCPYAPPEQYVTFRAGEAPTPGRLYNGRRVWLVTRYDQARAVLHDERFSSDITHPGYPVYAGAFEGFRAFPLLNTIDPPLHTVHRKALVREFTLRRAEDLRPRMRAKADELIDAMVAGGESGDLVGQFAEPFSASITCWALGMEYADMRAWLASTDSGGGPPKDPEEAAAEAGKAILALQEYFTRFVDAKDEDPGDDPISRVISRHVVTGALSKAELANLCFVIFTAGQKPVQTMLTVGVALLLERPEQLAVVRQDPEVLPAAVDETIRMVSPLDLMPRFAREDVEVGGQLIRAGEGVIVAGGGANRDPAEFPVPDRFDVRRAARGHLAFGSGIHHCLGANLTSVALEVAYGTLFRRLPELRLTTSLDEAYTLPSWHPDIPHLPVAW